MIKHSLHWYNAYFAYLAPLGMIILVSLFMDKIPYLNLYAESISTFFITVSLLLIWKLTLGTRKLYEQLLVILLICAIMVEIFYLRSTAEVIGNVLFLLLSFYVMFCIWEKSNFSL